MEPRSITAVIVLALVMSGWFSEEWEGFVYPNKNNLSEDIYLGAYKSLEECRASAISSLKKISSASAGDYECGLNCESESDMGDIKVCEKTER